MRTRTRTLITNVADNALWFHGTVAIETHGCKLNQADSDVLARRFLDAGYRVVAENEPAGLYVVNTCTVTHVADRKARRSLRSAHRRNPNAMVIATGCYAQRDPVGVGAVDGVDIVVGNSQKSQLVDIVLAARVTRLPLAPWARNDPGSHLTSLALGPW